MDHISLFSGQYGSVIESAFSFQVRFHAMNIFGGLRNTAKGVAAEVTGGVLAGVAVAGQKLQHHAHLSYQV